MPDLVPDALEKPVGPLPLYGWVAALAAGLGLAYVWNKRRGASEGTSGGDETTTDPSTAAESASAFLPTSFVVGGGGLPATGNSGGGSVTGDGTTTDETEPKGYQTNSQWRNAAVSFLVGKGVSGAIADDVIARYLESQSLNAQQVGVLNLAVQALGGPPDPPPAAPQAPPDPTQPASQPVPVAPPTPAPAPPPVAAAPSLPSARFVIGDQGGQVWEVMPGRGLRPITSEAELYQLGGGGVVHLAGGIVHTFHGNPGGVPPVPYPVAYLNSLPRA